MGAVIPIDKISRVVLVVRDHRRAAAQISRFFGIRKWDLWHRTEADLAGSMLDGEPARFSYHSAIGANGSVKFELIEPGRGESAFSRFLDWHGPGISHVVVGGAGPFEALQDGLKVAGIGVAQFVSAGAHDYRLLDTRGQLGGLGIMLAEANDRTERAPQTMVFADPAVLPVQQLYQVSVIVKDRDAAKARFDKLLGVSAWVDIGIDTNQGIQDATYYGKPADQAARIAIGRTGDACFEVVEHLRGETVYKDVVDKHGEAPHHVMCTICPPGDYQRAVKTVAEWGVEVSQGATIPGLMGFGYFDGREQLAGLFVEVITPLADNWLELMFPSPEIARIVVGKQ